MPLKDKFNQLKNTIVGTKSADIDRKLDQAVADISKLKSNSGANGFMDLINKVISSTEEFKVDGQDSGLFSQGMSTPASFGQQDRLARYGAYGSIVTYINYAKRALNVLTDNILSPDDITKMALEIKPQAILEDEKKTNSKKELIADIIKKVKLEKHLDTVVKNTLQAGDFFCEISDIKSAISSQSILFEAQENIEESKNINDETNYFIVEKVKIKKDDFEKLREDVIIKLNGSSELEFAYNIDFSAFTESEEDDDKEDGVPIDKVQLLYHEGKHVVKLQSDMFPICFGYLVFPRSALSPQLSFKDQAINQICTSIVKNLNQKVPQMKELSNIDDLKDTLKIMIQNSNPNKPLQIRYVPPEKMQHFLIPSTKYFPYGESLFDSSQFMAKVLIAMETALTVQRLSKSTEKRKISIEMGLPRDAQNLIQNLKESFRKRKISLDSFGSVDTIPSMITTFEDIYIPQKDGKAFVDVSSFDEGRVDVRSRVDELKFMRDSLVADWGIPACIDFNTRIPLLSGETITMKEVIQNFEEGKDLWVYSYNLYSKKIVPGHISWAGITRKNAEVIKIVLDNDKEVVCTPDHKFILRDGTYIEAKDLKIDDSLMPNRKVKRIEILQDKIDTCCITVKKYHNFSIDAGIIIKNSFLSLEENLSNKNALGEESILFARTIISHQKYFSDQFSSLIEKIVSITHPEEALSLLDNVMITLAPPRSLQYEREARYLSELANLVRTLEEIGISKEWSKHKYLTSIDWQEVKDFEAKQKTEEALGTKKDDTDEFGGMGGLGGLGGGSGLI